MSHNSIQLSTMIKNTRAVFCMAALATSSFASSFASTASAQATGTPEFTVYDRVRGELSPDAEAPTRADLMRAIDVGRESPSQLAAALEYGERVECHECVAPLQRLMLDPSADPQTREMAAWWLRRRPFGFDAIMRSTRLVLASDPDPARRAAAAAAIGEFMDFHGVEHLGNALRTDADPGVRRAAVLGLARINSPRGLPLIATALTDSDSGVVDAALRTVLRVNFFRDHAALIPLLAHEDGAIRRRAALVVGTLAIESAVPALAAMLRGDTDVMARQSAAWALGRITASGSASAGAARSALSEARTTESSRRVLDAVEVALRM